MVIFQLIYDKTAIAIYIISVFQNLGYIGYLCRVLQRGTDTVAKHSEHMWRALPIKRVSIHKASAIKNAILVIAF